MLSLLYRRAEFLSVTLIASMPTSAFTFGAERDVKCEAWFGS